jgi:hypothetical protein
MPVRICLFAVTEHRLGVNLLFSEVVSGVARVCISPISVSCNARVANEVVAGQDSPTELRVVNHPRVNDRHHNALTAAVPPPLQKVDANTLR